MAEPSILGALTNPQFYGDVKQRLVDALRGGVQDAFPAGTNPSSSLAAIGVPVDPEYRNKMLSMSLMGPISIAKSGSLPGKIAATKVNNPASEWRSSDLLQWGSPQAMSGIVKGNPNMSIKELQDGSLALEHAPVWGSASKPFHMIGDSVEELVNAAKQRLVKSDAAVEAAAKSRFNNSLMGKLQQEFGDVFSTRQSTQSSSEYIIHDPSGTKIRIADHDLPLHYEQPDIDLRKWQTTDEKIAKIMKALKVSE